MHCVLVERSIDEESEHLQQDPEEKIRQKAAF